MTAFVDVIFLVTFFGCVIMAMLSRHRGGVDGGGAKVHRLKYI
jgi:hypothetical protein